ncbi:MAG: pantoate--beta-alanine ligase [Sphingobacteriales bacterium 40-81]|nr:MAG: pantoate--beta-alanine ligase [Sphingobacteriales bacterium 40-81]
MFIFKESGDLQKYLKTQAKQGFSIGFVPTMGALHEGHISLIKAAKSDGGITVASIFVNPTQFNDPDDFKLYPRTIEKDIYMLEKAGCDVLYLPEVKDLYPDGLPANEQYDLGYLETVLDGKYRPGHFQGVCQVVNRLMNAVQPGKLYLGQKDYQQCMVIKKLLSITGSKAEIVICPTLREQDGLAMSSRNMRLTKEQRINATGIYKTLIYLKNNIRNNTWAVLKKNAGDILADHNLVPDYIEIADADTLELLNTVQNENQVVALIAAYMGEVRLIDNMIIPLNFVPYGN